MPVLQWAEQIHLNINLVNRFDAELMIYALGFRMMTYQLLFIKIGLTVIIFQNNKIGLNASKQFK